MKAGCAYVALDEKIPDIRCNQIINDAKIKLVFIDSGQNHEFSSDVEIEKIDISDLLVAKLVGAVPILNNKPPAQKDYFEQAKKDLSEGGKSGD